MKPLRTQLGNAIRRLAVHSPPLRRSLIACVLAASLHPLENLQAAGDGPRIHGPLPVGFNALSLNGNSLQDANRTFDPSLIRPSQFDTSMANLAYLRTFQVKNRHVTFLGILRAGQAKRRVFLLGGKEVKSSRGLADPFFAFSVNLFGLPPMDRDAFRDFNPGLKVNFLLGAIPPLGEYDSQNAVNLSANRWTIRLGFPVTRPFAGIRGLPGTLELIPNVLLFTENQDRKLEQDPLFSLEGHVTQNFSARTWGSFGLIYEYGGKTSIRGVTANGSQQSLALTATMGFNLSPRWGLQLRYGRSVAQNEFGLVGTLYQFKLARFF